jgi:hypothetical protein
LREATDPPGGSPGEETSQYGTSTETVSKVVKQYRTKRLFFRFEIGTRKVTGPLLGSAGELQTGSAASAPPTLVAAPKALAAGAAGPMVHPQATGISGSSQTTRSVYSDITAGVTDMPPPSPPGPPSI